MEMEGVNNQPKKQIYLTVDNKYLEEVNQGTLGFGNHSTLEVLRYLFNMFGWTNLGDKERKY